MRSIQLPQALSLLPKSRERLATVGVKIHEEETGRALLIYRPGVEQMVWLIVENEKQFTHPRDYVRLGLLDMALQKIKASAGGVRRPELTQEN